jgi:hypothetical protein
MKSHFQVAQEVEESRSLHHDCSGSLEFSQLEDMIPVAMSVSV